MGESNDSFNQVSHLHMSHDTVRLAQPTDARSAKAEFVSSQMDRRFSSTLSKEAYISRTAERTTQRGNSQNVLGYMVK